jgi:hypothetical protein
MIWKSVAPTHMFRCDATEVIRGACAAVRVWQMAGSPMPTVRSRAVKSDRQDTFFEVPGRERP